MLFWDLALRVVKAHGKELDEAGGCVGEFLSPPPRPFPPPQGKSFPHLREEALGRARRREVGRDLVPLLKSREIH